MKSRNKKLIVIISSFLAVFVVAAVWFFFPRDGGGSPESAAKSYINATYTYDYDGICKYSAINVEKALDFLFSGDINYNKDNYKKIFESTIKKAAISELKSTYGDDYKLTISINNVDEYTEDEMYSNISDLRSQLSYMGIFGTYMIDFNKIKAISAVEGTLTITGRLDGTSESFTLCCAKIGESWKVLDDLSTLYNYFK